MKKTLKNGFTLVELMVGAGISSALVLIIAGALKQGGSLTGDLKRTGEINALIQIITSELSRKEVCEKNFKPGGVGVAPAAGALANIVNKSGVPIITQGAPYGEYIRNIPSIAYTFSAMAAPATKGSVINLTVTYTPKEKNGVAQPNKTFDIPINVFLNSAGTNVDTCFSDVESLMKIAVENACKGQGAKWYAYNAAFPQYPYGHCEHQVELLNAANGLVTPDVGTGDALCPAGELLRLIDTTNNKMTFKCSKLETAVVNAAGVYTGTSECNSWSYMKGINADGSVNCEDLRTLFNTSTGAGVMVARTSGPNVVYVAQPIACPANQILVQIKADGSILCMNPRLRKSCNPGEYLTINVSLGDTSCVPVSNNTTCANGRFIKAINPDGSVICADTSIPGGPCPANNVITGIDATGTRICTPLLP